MTLEYPRQVSGEEVETEKVIFVTEEMRQEEVKEAEGQPDDITRGVFRTI